MAKPAAVSTPLCSILHELRTAENSGGYFQPKLRSLKEAKPNLKLLDVGSGWGHMGCSLARALGPEGGVVGVDINPESLAHARKVAERCGLHERVEFVEGDAYKLPFPDNEFDVAHCHQVLAHLEQPWDVIREMMRVTRPGGFVAIREGDLESEIVYPPEPGLLKFHNLISTAMTARGKGGGGADSGRQLLPWALRAGAKRDQITVSYGTWWFDTPEHKDKWAKAMAGQVRDGMVGEIAKKTGLATEEDLQEMATAWEDWATREDSSLAMMHGEIVVEKK